MIIDGTLQYPVVGTFSAHASAQFHAAMPSPPKPGGNFLQCQKPIWWVQQTSNL
jgi:hypothetical protein